MNVVSSEIREGPEGHTGPRERRATWLNLSRPETAAIAASPGKLQNWKLDNGYVCNFSRLHRRMTVFPVRDECFCTNAAQVGEIIIPL